MNITKYIAKPEEFVTKKDIVVYNTASRVVGQVIKAGTRVVSRRANAARHTVLINGRPYYHYLR